MRRVGLGCRARGEAREADAKAESAKESDVCHVAPSTLAPTVPGRAVQAQLDPTVTPVALGVRRILSHSRPGPRDPGELRSSARQGGHQMPLRIFTDSVG